MNTMKQLMATSLMALMLTSFSFAQDFDANRMNRDIRIMENVLSELFKVEAKSHVSSSADNRTVEVRGRATAFTFNSFGRSSEQVTGDYIPGYGVIFKVPAMLSANISRISVNRDDRGEKVLSFYYDSDDASGDSQITEEAVKQRITNFLKDYAPTIGQLDKEERVTIVYGERKGAAPKVRIFNFSDEAEQETEIEPIPVITVSAKAGDLASLRNGRLSSDDFDKQLSVKTSDENKKQPMDLQVMSNILKTAFEDGGDEAFHLVTSNSLSYVNIEGFGVHYTLDMHRGHGLQSITLRAFSRFEESDAEVDETAKKVQIAREEREETIKAEYQKMVEQIKMYMVDYGRTLNSLSNDHFLIISANLLDHGNLIPAQVNFQLKKSVLQQLDRGQISREAALNAVTLTEY